MELFLIMEQKMTEFVADRERLAGLGMQSVHTDDCVVAFTEQKAGQVAFQRISVDARALAPGDRGDRDRSVLDVVLGQQRLDQCINFSLADCHGVLLTLLSRWPSLRRRVHPDRATVCPTISGAPRPAR